MYTKERELVRGPASIAHQASAWVMWFMATRTAPVGVASHMGDAELGKMKSAIKYT